MDFLVVVLVAEAVLMTSGVVLVTVFVNIDSVVLSMVLLDINFAKPTSNFEEFYNLSNTIDCI